MAILASSDLNVVKEKITPSRVIFFCYIRIGNAQLWLYLITIYFLLHLLALFRVFDHLNYLLLWHMM